MKHAGMGKCGRLKMSCHETGGHAPQRMATYYVGRPIDCRHHRLPSFEVGAQTKHAVTWSDVGTWAMQSPVVPPLVVQHNCATSHGNSCV